MMNWTQSRPENFVKQSKTMNTYQDESSYNSRILHTIRSIVDELYEMNTQESSLVNEPKEKRVRFTLQSETETNLPNKSKLTETLTKYQPVLSESATVVCCLIKGRSKVDCSVSTNDFPSLQCESSTQTMNNINFSTYNQSSMSLLTTSISLSSIDLHRSRSNITLSTTWISSNTTISLYRSSFPTICSCENHTIIPSMSTAHQLILPSEVKLYNICQEQTSENYNTFFTCNTGISSSSLTLKERKKSDDFDLSSKSSRKFLNETDIKFCTCSKRKRSDNDFSMEKMTFSYQDKLLEELHLSKRSLQSMHNDNLVYVYDLVLLFLRNTSHFHQILLKKYYLSQKEVKLFVKIMNKWWKKHRTKFNNINTMLSSD